MKKNIIILLVFFLAGCTTVNWAKSAFTSFISPKSRYAGYYKVGNPYRIDSKWYYPKEDPDYEETGVASWYGSDFHNNVTGNGEIFDKDTISAAHRTLPMPSMVRVTNMENGKTLLVRVNDRGPYVRDRIIDLSEKAAKLLDFHEVGTTKVKVAFDKEATERMFADSSHARYKRSVETEIEAEVATANSGHFIQVGAYTSSASAQTVADKLKIENYVSLQKVAVYGKTFYRVRVGPFEKIEDADNMLNRIVELGFENAIII